MERAMAGNDAKPKGPDLTQGVSLAELPDGGMIGGHVGEDAVLIARRGDELYAIGATCSHYGGPLAEGLIVDDAAPYDRPNCSKDYLAGNAPEEWMPLKPPEYYAGQSIDLKLRAEVASIDPKAKQVKLADGKTLPFDVALLATGAEPVRLDIP